MRTSRISTQDYVTRLALADQEHGDRSISLLGKYEGMHVKTLHRCNRCAHEWRVAPMNLVYPATLQNCPVCGTRKVKPLSYFANRLKAVHGKRIHFALKRISRDRKHGSYIDITATCAKCSHVWKPAMYNSVGLKAGCPNFCFVRRFHVTKPHRLVSEWLTSIGVVHEVNNRDILPNRTELDIFVPSKNVAIEINGVYWHTDKFLDTNAHYSKTLACKKLGIKLLHIWDLDVVSKPRPTKEVITRFLKIGITVDAKDCFLEPISPQVHRNFVLRNSLEYGIGYYCYGLYHQGKLLQSLAFQEDSPGCWSIKPAAYEAGYYVDGGTKRIFDYFVEKVQPRTVSALCNMNFSLGEELKPLGFKITDIQRHYSFLCKSGRLLLPQEYAEKGGYQGIRYLKKFDSLSTVEENLASNYAKLYDAGIMILQTSPDYIAKIIQQVEHLAAM